MKILFVINSLRFGGAERMTARLASDFAHQGHDITIVKFDSAPSDFEVSSLVKIHNLGTLDSTTARMSAANTLFSVSLLRRFIQELQPDVIVPLVYGAVALTRVATYWLNIPIVPIEVTKPDYFPAHRRALYRILLALIPRIIAVSESAKRGMPRSLRMKTVVIPQPCTLCETPIPPPGAPVVRIGTVGRLVREKGHDALIQALARCSGFEFEGIIWGEGPERPKLEELLVTYGLEQKVSLPGATYKALESIQTLDIFVLSSRVEGKPTSLIEAMSCQRPCVSFPCEGAISEIIEDGQTGIIVPQGDIEALASCITRLAKDSSLRDRLAINGRNTVVHRFNPQASAQHYLDEIMGSINSR